jgi:galacturan 1,4-alpha-galacturonidase
MIKKVKIAYIGGGSRLWARNLMSDLALEPEVGGTVALYDIDEVSASNNALIGNQMMKHPSAVGQWEFIVSHTLVEALTDADFVFISILPGTFDEMQSYVHIPEKWGIYQPVGDTAGIAGLFRALITMPIYEGFAKAIEKHCPNAWVFNFTNPMTMCVQILYHVFPGIKAFGNCHEVFSTQKILAKALEEKTGIKAKHLDIQINPLGINHFTWITHASYRDIDLFPLYRSFALEHHQEGLDEGKYPDQLTVFQSAEKVKLDLFLKTGVIAAAGDRHLVEFLPHDRYAKDRATIQQWKFFLTPVSFRKENMAKGNESALRIIAGKEEAKIVPSGEEGIAQLKALLGLQELITNVNMPNVGQVTNLPLGAVVETNALFRRDYVHPIHAGCLPEFPLAITLKHVHTHQALIQAFDHKDLNDAKQALHQDPTVSHLPVAEIDRMFDEIVGHMHHYLDYYVHTK